MMKTRTLRRQLVQVLAGCILAGSLILGSMWGLAQVGVASGPEHPSIPQRGEPPPQPVPVWSPDSEEVFPHSVLDSRAMRGVNAATVNPGQPGLSFRYVETFGETEVAYISDTSHINFPWGITAEGNNIWIGESWGQRALKFTNTGTFLTSIGKAGFYRYQDQVLGWIADVAVDNAGNIWVADDTSHVLKFDANGDYVSELGETWTPGSDNEHFETPAGIAFDSDGNIYISDGGQWWGSGSDVGNHRLQIFDSDGNYLNTIGETGVAGSGNYQFHGPGHIVIYSDTLYVADSGNHRVQIFDVSNPASPVYSDTIGITDEAGSDSNHLDRPFGVAVDASYVYVADSDNNRVQIFDRATQAYVDTIGTGWGTGNTQFKFPSDVTVDAAGNIYVADFVNNRVQQFDSNRNYVRTYGVTGVPYVTDGYHYNAPAGIISAPDGSIYIVESNGHRLVKLNADGDFQWAVGAAGVKGDWDYSNDRFNNPADVTLDADGRIYVSDRWHSRVQIFNPDGSYYDTLGSGGTGEGEFDGPGGLTIAPNGHIYVADTFNHRIQIFDSGHNHVANLGETAVSGSDNSHFNHPQDVAVDSNGMIYVADTGNHRVQVFDASRAHVRTIGEAGVSSDDFDHFANPERLFIDSSDRLYVADSWNNRVQVFDQHGAYLTTIGGSWGTGTGQMRDAAGIAVDSAGNVYVTDRDNHRVQKFSPGVPGWKQVNLNGFGDRSNIIVSSLGSYSETLHAGTYGSSGNGAQLWQLTDVGWTAVITDGFGDANNVAIDHLTEFDGKLYAGTWNWNDAAANNTEGGQLWRSDDGAIWDPVTTDGFGNPTNARIFHFIVFDNQIYATTWSYTDTHGTEVWRSDTGDSGDWEQVVGNGFDGEVNNQVVLSFEVFNGHLYAGTYNLSRTPPYTSTGGEVWRSPTGDAGTWSQVNADGFGNPDNRYVRSLAAFNGYLYAGTSIPSTGGQVWRCSDISGCDEDSDWSQVVGDGFGNPDNTSVVSLVALNDALYAVAYNGSTGMEVWQTESGNPGEWRQVGFAGFGDSNNIWSFWDNSVTTFDNRLYIGTFNLANGGEVWRKNAAGDLNGDDALTIQDLSWMAGWWRQAGDYYFDLDGDGRLTVADLIRWVVLWGGG